MASEFEPPQEDDPKASAEALDISEQRLEADGKWKDHTRKHRFRDHLNRGITFVFWMVIGYVAWGMFAYVWHLLMPENWHYLNADQLDNIRTILGTAILSSAIAGYASKQMQD